MSSDESDGPLLLQRVALNNEKVGTSSTSRYIYPSLHVKQSSTANTPVCPTQAVRTDSDSPLPDWLSQHTSPVKTLEMLSDSDDAVELDAEEGAHNNGSRIGAVEEAGAVHSAGHGGGQHVAEGLGNSTKGKRKATSTVILSSDEDVSPLPKAPTRQGAARKKQKQDAGKAAPLEPGSDQAVGPSIALPDRRGPDLQQASLKNLVPPCSCAKPWCCTARAVWPRHRPRW